MLQACRRLGVGFVAFSPLGRGFLTASIKSPAALPADDRRRAFPRFQGEHLQRNLRTLEKFESLARAKGCTPGQLALAWLVSRGEDIVPIPGTRRSERLAENIDALSLQLNAADLAAIDRHCGPGAFSGKRYQPSDMALVAR